jgi:cullin 4
MISRLVSFKLKVEEIIKTVFVDTKAVPPVSSSRTKRESVPNQEFIYALTDAFTKGFKARAKKPAEMLAKHLDKTLRKGQKSATDESFLKDLDNALALYRFTDDRDVFRTFYQRLLAKRLLLDRSASDDFELTMLKKLKDGECPIGLRCLLQY